MSLCFCPNFYNHFIIFCDSLLVFLLVTFKPYLSSTDTRQRQLGKMNPLEPGPVSNLYQRILNILPPPPTNGLKMDFQSGFPIEIFQGSLQTSFLHGSSQRPCLSPKGTSFPTGFLFVFALHGTANQGLLPEQEVADNPHSVTLRSGQHKHS